MRIQSGILLTMGGERYENGYVDAKNGKITAFGSMNDAPVYSGETYDAEGGYILPGLIDAHTQYRHIRGRIEVGRRGLQRSNRPSYT